MLMSWTRTWHSLPPNLLWVYATQAPKSSKSFRWVYTCDKVDTEDGAEAVAMFVVVVVKVEAGVVVAVLVIV